jgi:predicted mannosyl-3-phosphoglycerate phosphatase (HAD superfamily)
VRAYICSLRVLGFYRSLNLVLLAKIIIPRDAYSIYLKRRRIFTLPLQDRSFSAISFIRIVLPIASIRNYTAKLQESYKRIQAYVLAESKTETSRNVSHFMALQENPYPSPILLYLAYNY